MKRLLFFVIVLSGFCGYSQNTPKVVISDSTQLKLVNLHVDVKITGNFASTTYDMKFYNGFDRVLEGELEFPLGEGQSVSKFAMDINGKIREAVVVEKELARTAYESTIRQNIDPGLLEKTEGNNYKARVYPILANNYKHIIITYEQELPLADKQFLYELPLGISDVLDKFSISIDVFKNMKIPIIKSNIYKGLNFKENDSSYRAEYVEKNISPLNPLLIQIPLLTTGYNVLYFQDYFYANILLDTKPKTKEKPKKIIVLWDASYSLKNRNLTKELKLLKDYLDYLRDVNLRFICFSNEIRKEIDLQITEGNSSELMSLIKDVDYDGGTSFDSFDIVDYDADEILFFTDGLSNLGDFPEINKIPVYTINSNISAKYDVLKGIANNSGANFINLLHESSDQALSMLKLEAFQFLGVEHNDGISEVFPQSRRIVNSDFSITGRFSKKSNLKLLFGYHGKVTKQIQLNVDNVKESNLVKRLWALNKLDFLNEDKAQNQDEIISLAKQYHLVSDYTSMLILDRIEDYVRYRIEPPAGLKREYKRMLADIEEQEALRNNRLEELKNEIQDDYSDIEKWYNAKYSLKNLKTNIIETESESEVQITDPQDLEDDRENRNVNFNQGVTTIEDNIRNRTFAEPNDFDPDKRVIYGKVITENGEAVPFTNVVNNNSSSGTTTDFDGYFMINAETDDELQFTFVGMKTLIYTIGTKDTILVKMEESSMMLDEVMIVDYSVSRETTSHSRIVSSNEIEYMAGRTAGVEVTAMGVARSQNIGNYSSNSTNGNPLFVVDGEIVKGFSLQDIKPDEIESIQLYNAESASKIYGSLASNGLILIITKQGRLNNSELISELEKKISDKIELKTWNPKTPYITILEEEKSVNEAYNKYLELRDTYSNSPSFYLDVADFFDKRNNTELAIRILTNLIEVELNNYELLKALAYKLEYFNQYKLAIQVYKKILELRPEEPQSYRDLALAYEANNQIRKSYDLLFKLYNGELLEKDETRRYNGIESIAYVELNRLVSKYADKLKITEEEKKRFNSMPVDVRVLIDWNHGDTDIDLWVIDPNGEKAYYQHPRTKIGGRLSNDFVDGYGPEEFMLKNAIKGDYKILVDYYSDNLQKISGPTILKVTLFTNYAKKDENRKIIVIRLDKEEDDIEVGTLHFE